MMSKVIGALLAAALVPAAASAQQRDGSDDGPRPFQHMRDDARGNAMGHARVERPDQPEARPERPQRVEQPAATVDPGARNAWQGGRGRGGGDRGRPPVDASQPAAQVQGGFDGRRDWRGRQDNAGQTVPRFNPYGDRAPGQVRDGARLDDRSQIDTRSRFDDRSRTDGRRFDNRTNYDNRRFDGRPYDNRGYQDRSTFDRGYDNRRYGDRGDAGRWSRDWRRDDRYDWTRYRSSNRNAFHLPRYYSPYGWDGGYRRFSIGVTLSSVLWGQDYWIDDPFNYRLPEAYGPYRWVRYYNDALLVDLRTGLVVDTVYDIFY